MKSTELLNSLRRIFLSSIAASSLFVASHAIGQVNGVGPSESSLFDTVVNIPEDQAAIGNLELIGGVDGETTQFNLSEGGSVGSLFGALSGAEVNISGGMVGDASNPDIEALRAFIGSELNVSGGEIGNNAIVRGATFNMSGGTVGSGLEIESSSVANITGGDIGSIFASSSSTVDISGGTFRAIRVDDGTATISGGTFERFNTSRSVNNISGGIFNSRPRVSGTGIISGGQFGLDTLVSGTIAVSGGEFGNEFSAGPDSVISGGTFGTQVRGSFELRGNDFKLNGIPYIFNSSISIDDFSSQNDGDVFTGVLEDGSSFIFADRSGDSLNNVLLTTVEVPAADLTPLVVNTPFPNLPAGLRDGQTLTLQDGGVLGNNFEIVDATLTVEAGTIGDRFGMSRSTVNLNGGMIGDGFHSNRGCEIDINGGSIGNDFQANLGSVVTLTEGAIGDNFSPRAGSEFVMSGGSLGQGFAPRGGTFADDALVRISGGTIGRGFTVLTDDVEISGGEFQLNGRQYRGATISLDFGSVFTGTLSDGSAFVFAGDAGDRITNLKLNETAVPDVNTTPIVVNASTPNGPASLRFGQTLTLEQGGVINGEFEAVDAVINIDGGSIEGDSAFSDTTVNLNDGSIAANALALAETVFNINGGSIGDNFRVASESVVNLNDGTIGDNFRIASGSQIFISGGTVGRDFRVPSGGLAKISGGTFGRGFDVGSGVELSGGEFQLNGVDYNEPTVSISFADVFSGTLSDGSTFLFTGRHFDDLSNVQLNRTDLPDFDSNPIVIDASTSVSPTGVRTGQTLLLEEGGMIDGEFETVGGTIVINGGSVAGETAFSNTTVTLNEGSITGAATFFSSTVNLNDGVLGTDGTLVEAASGSEFNLIGGTVGGLIARSGSEVNIFGDVFESNDNDESTLNAQSSSTVNLFAIEFSIDGNEVEFTDPDTPLLINDRGITVSGVFLDGSEFEYLVIPAGFGTLQVAQGADLQLNLVTAPPVLRGDVNLDSTVDFDDISPFITILATGDFQAEADVDTSGEVTFDDILPFIEILSGP